MHCCAAFSHRALCASCFEAVVEFGPAPVTQVGLLVVVTVALGGVGGLGSGPALAGLLAVEAVAWRGGWPRPWPERPRG